MDTSKLQEMMHTIGNQTYNNLHITPEWGLNIQDKDIELLKPYITRKGKIIDIGANLGIFSIIYSQVYPYTQFICFEPTPHIAEHCGNNLTKVGLPFTMYQTALSNRNDVAHFRVGTMHQTNKLAVDGIEVEVRELDTYNFTDVAVIKIDVEGHELEVLQGARNTIVNQQPIIILEYHPEADSAAIFDFIEELEYDIIFLEGQFNAGQCNHFLLKPNHTYLIDENNSIQFP